MNRCRPRSFLAILLLPGARRTRRRRRMARSCTPTLLRLPGAKLEGGKAGASSAAIAHGGDETLIQTIMHGYPNRGMPGFSATVSSAECCRSRVHMKRARRRADPEVHASYALPVGSRERGTCLPHWSVAEDRGPVASGLLPDELVTERAGRLRVIENGNSCRARRRRARRGGEGRSRLMSAWPIRIRAESVDLSFVQRSREVRPARQILRAAFRETGSSKRNIFSIAGSYQNGYVLFGWPDGVRRDYLFSVGERGMEEKTPARRRNSACQWKNHRCFPMEKSADNRS